MTFLRFGAVVFVVMLCITSAAAEERLGVVVYPGAKYDAVRTKMLAENPSLEGAAFRTNDPIAKVTAFYRKQGFLFLKVGGPSEERARFRSTDGETDVVVQQPWKDAQTGSIMHDTLILILREKPKN